MHPGSVSPGSGHTSVAGRRCPRPRHVRRVVPDWNSVAAVARVRGGSPPRAAGFRRSSGCRGAGGRCSWFPSGGLRQGHGQIGHDLGPCTPADVTLCGQGVVDEILRVAGTISPTDGSIEVTAHHHEPATAMTGSRRLGADPDPFAVAARASGVLPSATVAGDGAAGCIDPGDLRIVLLADPDHARRRADGWTARQEWVRSKSPRELAESTRDTVPASESTTHSAPSAAVMPVGPSPTSAVEAHGVGRRIDADDPVRRLVGDPHRTSFRPPPRVPTALVSIVVMTWPVRSSMRVRVRASPLVTHTEPNPTARATGPAPTWMVSTTAFVSGLIRETVSSSWLATQTLPPPTATPLGSFPTGIVWTTAWVWASMRTTARTPARRPTRPAVDGERGGRTGNRRPVGHRRTRRWTGSRPSPPPWS